MTGIQKDICFALYSNIRISKQVVLRTKRMAKAVKSDKNTDQNYVDSDLSYLPAVTYPDIVNYLLFTPSPYTATDLKCYKGLEAYNQIVCGWVRDVVSKKVERRCLVKAKVSSFRPSRSFIHFIFDSPF